MGRWDWQRRKKEGSRNKEKGGFVLVELFKKMYI